MNRMFAPLPNEEAPADPATSALRMVRRLLGFLLGSVLVAVSFTYLLPVLNEQKTLKVEEAQTTIELAKLREVAAAEEEKLKWMRYDPDYIGIHARDRLDLQAPDESVIRFQSGR